MIQLAVEDEVLVMPLDLMSESDTGLACAGLGCGGGGLGDIAPSTDKVLRKLAKADKAAKKAARKGETPPTIPSLPDFVLPKIGQPIDIPPGPPQHQYVVDWIPRPETWTFPGPTDPVLTLPSKPVGPMPLPPPIVTLPPVTGGSYQPPDGRDYMDPLLPTPSVQPRRDWRQVLGAPRRGRRRSEGGSDTGTAVESPPFQAPPTVSVGPPASPAGSVGMPTAPEPTEQSPADPGVLNIGGMQIRTSTLMWAGAIVGGFILLNNMTGKKR